MSNLFKMSSAAVIAMFANISFAQAFSFTFDWGHIPKCTTGNPTVVSNPIFNLIDVPASAAKISFHLRDSNVPDFNHGGGNVAFAGSSIIASGVFKYKSPCPPDGSHIYVWTAIIYDKSGKKLASATSSQGYP